MVNALFRTIGEATDVAAVVGVTGDINDILGGQYVVGIAVAVGHEVDVPGSPVGSEHALECAFLGVGDTVEAPGVGLQVHDPGLLPRIADDAGEVGLTQRPVLLQDGDAVAVGGTAHRPEGATDGHSRVVSRHRDRAHNRVVDRRSEASQLLGLEIQGRGAPACRGVDLSEGARHVESGTIR